MPEEYYMVGLFCRLPSQTEGGQTNGSFLEEPNSSDIVCHATHIKVVSDRFRFLLCIYTHMNSALQLSQQWQAPLNTTHQEGST